MAKVPAQGGTSTTKTTAQKSITTLTQPPFDPRIRTVHQPFLAGDARFDRGFMVWDEALTGSVGGYSAGSPPSVSFLFNPSTVQASYSISNSSSANSTMIFGVPPAGGGGVPYVQLQQSMSFTIMFDRTYELNSPNAAGSGVGSDVAAMGCEVDVRAMKQFTGMFSNQNSPTSGFYTGGSAAAATNTEGVAPQTLVQSTGVGVGPQQGLMLMIPSYVYFGSSLLGGTSQYYGYVEEWDVQYTHYTSFMVPIRCVVDISYTLLPIPSAAAAEYTSGAVQALATSQNQIPSAAFTGG